MQSSASSTEAEYEESYDEDIDDFSEEDDMDDDRIINCNQSSDSMQFKHDDATTQQLLRFAETVNNDIQKYFGKKKNDDHWCNIYEDNWPNGKSGRERYYADLLRMARGETDNSEPVKQKYTGKMNQSAGLGPLDELFKHGLNTLSNSRTKDESLTSVNASKVHDSIPMTERRFPSSFWQEPIKNDKEQKEPLPEIHAAKHKERSSKDISSASMTPDFTDLLESWTGEEHLQFSSNDLHALSSQNNKSITH